MDYENYTKFISRTPIPEEIRERGLAWKQNPALFWEYVQSKEPSETIFMECGYAVFWSYAYSSKHNNNLSPFLKCDLGIVDLNLNALNVPFGSGKTGSWLIDIFVKRYDWQQKKLPEDVIGELVGQVTETAALNGAFYTKEALDIFIYQLESIGNIEDEIIENLFFGCLLESAPEEAKTLENEELTTEAFRKAAALSHSSLRQASLARDVVQITMGKGDSQKARRVAMNVLRELAKRERRTIPYLFPNVRSHSRARRSPVRSAAASSPGDSDGDPDQGDPPRPSLTVPSLHSSPSYQKLNSFPFSWIFPPSRWSMAGRWAI